MGESFPFDPPLLTKHQFDSVPVLYDAVSGCSANNHMTTQQSNAFKKLSSACEEAEKVFSRRELSLILQRYERDLGSVCNHASLVFKNGKTMSVQAGPGLYCTNNNINVRCFWEVECFSCGDNDVRTMTSHELMDFANENGGIERGTLPSLDFCSPESNEKRRRLDGDALDYRYRKIRHSASCLPSAAKPFQGVFDKWVVVQDRSTGSKCLEVADNPFIKTYTSNLLNTVEDDDVVFTETHNSVYGLLTTNKKYVRLYMRVGPRGTVGIQLLSKQSCYELD